MEKIDKRSYYNPMWYLEVVSSSLRYLPGICLVFTAIVCARFYHVQSFISLRFIGLRVRVVLQVSNVLTLSVFVTFHE